MGSILNVAGLLASKLGVAEPAMRLLFSVLLGYPLAFVYQKYIKGRSQNEQSLYFFLTGLYLGYYNYGFDIIHCLVNVLFTYGVMLFVGPTRTSVALVFISTMVYLLYGYILNTTTDGYDFTFTMPLCVLVLRLIGLVFNYYDGNRRDQEKLSNDMKEVAIKRMPTILEVLGFSFFPSSFMIGPQFPITRYLDLIAGKFNNVENKEVWSLSSATMKYAIQRALAGVFYLGVYHIGSSIITDDFMISDELDTYPFWRKCFYLGIWGRLVFYKYICIWLLGEGACILFGLGYNGTDKEGNLKFDKIANIRIRVLENARSHIHYVESFNINTNQWVLVYIYKRLRFFGNKYVSQAAVLLFLSVWHGIHSGYYTTFFMEFVIVAFEKDMIEICKKNETFLNYISKQPQKTIVYIILKLYTFVFIGYCNGPFAVLTFHKWWHLYKSFYFMGHLFLFWPIYKIFIIKFLLPPKNTSKKTS
nr:PREDICTED: lysophospholipid acyltransferase 5 [Bemisia tabaci]XP_018895703.1 PREDICTED: lysophospholipid acyltransferase 5 [Bemisia tabaci]